MFHTNLACGGGDLVLGGCWLPGRVARQQNALDGSCAAHLATRCTTNTSRASAAARWRTCRSNDILPASETAPALG